MCWSGLITNLSNEQLEEMWNAERFYEKVSPIIKRGNSYIYRTDICSFNSPQGTQVVARYSEDEEQLLIVVHSFENAKEITIELKGEYVLVESLYKSAHFVKRTKLVIFPDSDFEGNVYLLKKVN